MLSLGKGYIGNDCCFFLYICGVLYVFVYDICIICIVCYYFVVLFIFKYNYFEYIYILNMN